VSSKTSAAVRLFNLSPDTKDAGMNLGPKSLVKDVAFSLGSAWVDVPTASGDYTFQDDLTAKQIATLTHTPPAAPLGAHRCDFSIKHVEISRDFCIFCIKTP
jgi:hypothetical protein